FRFAATAGSVRFGDGAGFPACGRFVGFAARADFARFAVFAILAALAGLAGFDRFGVFATFFFAALPGRRAFARALAMAVISVERAVDHVHLLLARQAYEVHGVARDADREARVLLRVVDRVEQRLA